ncbi:hypothetical protein, partial [Chamaesiphon sp. OTE_8_metabat_110]|uniref:hypothetical protein n=1 Tax=Chamaesiphon sp. OTE_8_metabat_110 TaxID=2964696 RepID=UPI00286AA191
MSISTRISTIEIVAIDAKSACLEKVLYLGKQATFAGEASPAKLAPLFPHFSLRGLKNFLVREGGLCIMRSGFNHFVY